MATYSYAHVCVFYADISEVGWVKRQVYQQNTVHHFLEGVDEPRCFFCNIRSYCGVESASGNFLNQLWPLVYQWGGGHAGHKEVGGGSSPH